MKKILLITSDFWPNQKGGVATYYAHVCKYLAHYAEVHVLTLPTQQEEIQTKYTIHRKELFFKRMYPKWLKTFWSLHDVMRQEEFDHILVGQVIPMGTAVLGLASLYKIPYSVFLHGMDIAILSGRKRKIADQVLNHSEHVFCNSNYTKSLIDARLHAKTHIISPCPNESLFLKKAVSEIASEKPALLSVCRLVRRKGVRKVIEALPDIINSIPHVSYMIVGNGPQLPELQELVGRLGVQKHVTFQTNISDEELIDYYRSCDVFIMTPEDDGSGDIEGFGIVYLEANAFGKPVIATQTGGVSEAVLHNKTGIVLNQTTNKDISQAVLHLMKNDGIRNDLGYQGKMRIINQFSWQHQVHKLVEILL